MTLVFYLDRYHLGDPLFLSRFARDLGELENGVVLVHGAGEDGERLLEGAGGIAAWDDGLLVVGSEAERALVERGARELNRRIAHALNEAGIAAVRLDGGSRSLLHVDGDGSVRVTGAGWLRELVARGGVPVVASLVPVQEGAMREVRGGAVAASLAAALGHAAAVFLTRGEGTTGGIIALEGLSEGSVGEYDALRDAVHTRSGEVRLCRLADVRRADSATVRVVE